MKSGLEKYILKDGKVTIASDLMEWSKWFEDSKNRIIDQTILDGLRVSTVFLGIDHNFFGAGEPVLFETMVFEDRLETSDSGFKYRPSKDDLTERYCTLEEAKAGHRKVVNKLTEKIKLVDEEAKQ